MTHLAPHCTTFHHTRKQMMKLEDDGSHCNILQHTALQSTDFDSHFSVLNEDVRGDNLLFCSFAWDLVMTLESVTAWSQLRLKFIRAILGQIALLLNSQPKTQNHSTQHNHSK